MKNLIKATVLLSAFASPTFADDMKHMMKDVTIGDMTLTGGFAHATLPNQPVAGGFMTITNAGDAADTLIAVQSDIANVMQLHEMGMQDDTMFMREVAGGIAVPAGETVSLEPGGLHIMFMQLQGPLVAGETVDVTLTFEQAGEVAMTLPIQDKMDGGHDMSHGTDGDS